VYTSGGISTQMGDFLLVFLYIDTDILIYKQGFVVLTSLVLYFSSHCYFSTFSLALYLRSFYPDRGFLRQYFYFDVVSP
jgi:hypothetical protein